jgi:hypothetical protein
MSYQPGILAEAIHRERKHALSPAEEKHRDAARLLEVLHCCTRASWTRRLQALFDGTGAGCCVSGNAAHCATGLSPYHPQAMILAFPGSDR